MNRWNPKANEIFAQALEIESAPGRTRFVDEACDDDGELRAQVGAMLKSHQEAGSFLQRPASGLEIPLDRDERNYPLTADYQPTPDRDVTMDHPVRDAQVTTDHVPGDESIPFDLPRQAGRYRVVGEVARGGMGAVMRAHDPDLDRTLAVKVMLVNDRNRPALEQRFLEEAQITGQLQHPGVPPVHELGRLEDGRAFFAMKLIDGRTLNDLLREHKEVGQNLPRFLGIFEQICQTIAYAHSRGILHRDLKPLNVMVGAFGEVQVMDWGLAKVVRGQLSVVRGSKGTEPVAIEDPITAPEDPVLSDEPRTRVGSVLGTPGYMAPEQARGEVGQLDERCDVFGLGAILCRILTGKPAFTGANTAEVLQRAGQGDVAEARQRLQNCGADAELIALALECLAPTKEERPHNASAVAQRVTAYLESVQARLKQAEIETAEAHVRAESEQKQRELAEGKALAERKRRRATLVMAVAALLLLGSVAFGGYAAWQQSSLEQARYGAGIERVYQLLTKYRYAEAQQTYDELNNSLSFWVPHSSQQQLKETRKDAQFLTVLDRVRQNRADVTDGRFFNPHSAAKEYEKAFQDFATKSSFPKNEGVVSESLVNWVGSRPPVVGEQVLAALDDWAVCIDKKDQKKKQDLVLAAIGQIDPNPVTMQFRQQLVRGEVKDVAKRIAGLDPKDISPQLLHSTALIIREKIGNQAALEFLERAQGHYPTDFWLLFTMANTYDMLEQRDLSIACFRAALAARPGATIVYCSWASTLTDRKDWDGAFAKCKKALEVAPKSALAYVHWGNALFRKRDYDEAIAKFTIAASLDPKHAKTHYFWGLALENKNDNDGAIAKYKIAATLDPHYDEPYGSWGKLLFGKNDFDGAIAKFTKVITINPNNAKAYRYWGNVLSDQKNFDGAIAKYKKAITLDPKDASAYYDWGNALFFKRDLDRSIAKFKKAISLDPPKESEVEAKAYANWGTVLVNKNDVAGAIAKFKKALALDSKEAKNKSYYHWGWILLNTKDFEGAIAKFKNLTILDPKDADGYYSWGTALLKRTDYDGAIAKFKIAAKFDSNRAKVYLNWGMALSLKRDLDEAIAKFEFAAKLDSKEANTYLNWGLMLAEKKDYDGAIAKFKKAAAFKPNDAKIHYQWGMALRDKGQFQLALEPLRRAQGMGYPAAKQWVMLCEKWHSLDQKREDILSGKVTVPAVDQLALAAACGKYIKRHGDAVKLYTGVFAKMPILTEPKWPFRFSATCSAALAAEGKGTDGKNITAPEKTQLRDQALSWLRADLKTFQNKLNGDRFSGPKILEWMKQRQETPDLTSIRDKEAVAKLPKEEQSAWTKLWSDFRDLEKAIRSSFTERSLQGVLTALKTEQTHIKKWTAGRLYVIEMHSKQFDTYLRLEDSGGKLLAQDDDGGGRNSRLTYSPTENGSYRIVATSFMRQGTGSYTLIVREFVANKR